MKIRWPFRMLPLLVFAIYPFIASMSIALDAVGRCETAESNAYDARNQVLYLVRSYNIEHEEARMFKSTAHYAINSYQESVNKWTAEADRFERNVKAMKQPLYKNGVLQQSAPMLDNSPLTAIGETYSIGTAQSLTAYSLAIVQGDSQIEIHPDGRVEYPGTLNEAAKIFWSVIGDQMPQFCYLKNGRLGN